MEIDSPVLKTNFEIHFAAGYKAWNNNKLISIIFV